MWVRSQIGRELVNAENFKIYDDGDAGIKIYANGFYVGVYEYEHQAQGVLNEIQERINEGCPQVYQMPKDEAEANTIDTTMMIENKDFYNALENAKAKREEVERAIEKFKSGFKGEE